MGGTSVPGIDPRVLDKRLSDGSLIIPNWDQLIPEETPELDPSHDSNEGDHEVDVDIHDFHGVHGLPARRQPVHGLALDPSNVYGLYNLSAVGAVGDEAVFDGSYMAQGGHMYQNNQNFYTEDFWNAYSMPNPAGVGLSVGGHVPPFLKGSRKPDGSGAGGDGSEAQPRRMFPMEHKPSTANQNPNAGPQMQSTYQTNTPLDFANQGWTFVPDNISVGASDSSNPLSADNSSGTNEARSLHDFSNCSSPLGHFKFPSFDEVAPKDGAHAGFEELLPPPTQPLMQMTQENHFHYGDAGQFPHEAFTSSLNTAFSTIEHPVTPVKQQEPDDVDVKASWPTSAEASALPTPSPTQEFSDGTHSAITIPTSPSPSASVGPVTQKSGSNQPSMPVRSVPTARKQKHRSMPSFDKAGEVVTLQIVQEDGQGGSIAPSACIPAVARARRNGPLSTVGRRDAASRRKDRSVCVWCRLAKKKCSGENPCDTCLEQAKTMICEQPCVKADFFQVVESGTCNYISQRAINHPTLDGMSRIRMEIPSTFVMKDLLSFLDERRGRFNIRASQSWGSLYVLDLDQTYRYLRELSKGEDSSAYDLRDFIDHRILKSNKWLRCVKDCDPMKNLFSLLSQWNNMPSRASYSFVPLADGEGERPMDVHTQDDRAEILLAAQLSRIVCRKLEVDGFKALQNLLNKNKWDDLSHDALTRFISQLGQILLTLRWRVSWWELLGDGGSNPDLGKERFEYRVQHLCKTLYFYYTSVKLKMPSWSDTSALTGVWSTYADAAPVWDDFPSVPTMQGFDAWMDRGKELIKQAGVQSRISKY